MSNHTKHNQSKLWWFNRTRMRVALEKYNKHLIDMLGRAANTSTPKPTQTP